MASPEVLAEIYHHLGAAEGRLCPGVERTRVAIRQARVRLEGLLGEPPVGERTAEGEPLGHLEEADAIAGRHLGGAGLEGQIRRAVGDALSAAREEL
ncbi:MAG: hypothetical protein H0V28_00440 [Rubrobacteraceae bacterium]|nr:hypothetical protein [Rubrobacteraceae bacterium]